MMRCMGERKAHHSLAAKREAALTPRDNPPNINSRLMPYPLPCMRDLFPFSPRLPLSRHISMLISPMYYGLEWEDCIMIAWARSFWLGFLFFALVWQTLLLCIICVKTYEYIVVYSIYTFTTTFITVTCDSIVCVRFRERIICTRLLSDTISMSYSDLWVVAWKVSPPSRYLTKTDFPPSSRVLQVQGSKRAKRRAT